MFYIYDNNQNNSNNNRHYYYHHIMITFSNQVVHAIICNVLIVKLEQILLYCMLMGHLLIISVVVVVRWLHSIIK